MLQMVMNNASIVDRLGTVHHLVVVAHHTFTMLCMFVITQLTLTLCTGNLPLI